MRLFPCLLIAATLTGCATPPMYQWGGYESQLYATYKDPAKAETMRQNLEAHIGLLEKSKQKVAPGLYAELGTLYLQAGASDQAVVMYARERDAWPESTVLMTSMITNIERRVAKPAVQK